MKTKPKNSYLINLQANKSEDNYTQSGNMRHGLVDTE